MFEFKCEPYSKYNYLSFYFIANIQQTMQGDATEVPPQSIWFFRPLDELMKKAVNTNKGYYCGLFQRKKCLLDLANTQKIDSKKYIAFVKNSWKTMEALKVYAQEEILQCTDKYNKNTEQWFKAKVKQASASLVQQQKQYNKFKTQVTSLKEGPQSQPNIADKEVKPATQNALKKPQQSSVQQQVQPIKNKLGYVLSQFINFKLLDHFLSKYYDTEYKAQFIQLYQKKLRLLDNVKSDKLKPDLYYQLSQKVHNETKHEQTRKILKMDIQSLAELYEGKVQKWFKQSYAESKSEKDLQQSIFDKHRQGVKVDKEEIKCDDLNISVGSDTSSPDVNPAECVSFPVLDNYLGKNSQENLELYIILYEKKKKLLELVKSKQLDVNSYQQFIKKAMKATQNQKLKVQYEFELENIKQSYDGDLNTWWSEVITMTKSELMFQEQRYKEALQELKSKPKKVVKKQEPPKPKPIQSKSKAPSQKLPFAVQKMLNGKILEDSLLQYGQDDQLFMQLFIQKQKIVQLVQAGSLSGKKYKVMQQKLLEKFADNQDIKSQIQFDIEDIDNMHNGDIEAWFNELVETAGSTYPQQLQRYQELLKKYPPKLQKKQSSKAEKPAAKRVSVKKVKEEDVLNFQVEKMFNVKILDDAILMNEDHPQIFTKLFLQKQKIVNLVQSGKLNGKTYKLMQQKSLPQFANNDDIKSQIEFDLEQIDTLHNGDVEAWFQELIQNAGATFEDQLSKYQQLASNKQQSKQKVEEVSEEKSIDPPPASQILSFTAIVEGVIELTKNDQFVKILSQKRQKFLDWLQAQKLNSSKYFSMCDKIFKETKNDWLKAKMQKQYFALQSQFENDKQRLFRQLSLCLKNKTKLKSPEFDSTVSLAEEHVNQGSSKSKVKHLLKNMAVYESLYKYFQANEIDYSKHQLISTYVGHIRKEIRDTIDRIQKQPSFDVVTYCKKFLPPLTEISFHQGVQKYKERLNEDISCFTKQINELLQYSKTLKKSCNKNNFQKVKTKTNQCQQNIKYLKELISYPGKLIPSPSLEVEKLQYPSMDQFTHLQVNEVQFSVVNIENAQSKYLLKIFYNDRQLIEEIVKNGQCKIITKIKGTQNQISNVMKGESKPFSVVIYEKGWFSNTELGRDNPELLLIKSNLCEGKIEIQNCVIQFEARVRMAKKPTKTPITEYKLKKYPPYEHSQTVEKQFISKYTPSKK